MGAHLGLGRRKTLLYPRHTRETATEPTLDTLVLRLGALFAAIPIIILRNSIDPRATLLRLLFFLTPYLLIALSPNAWTGFQVGFAVGYSVSMQVGLAASLIMQLMSIPHQEPAPQIYRHAFHYVNLALTVAAMATWIWSRRKTSYMTAVVMLMLGLVYPFFRFLCRNRDRRNNLPLGPVELRPLPIIGVIRPAPYRNFTCTALTRHQAIPATRLLYFPRIS
jgi:hypothetical protein